MKNISFACALICLVGCSSTKSGNFRAGLYKEGFDVPAGPVNITTTQSLIEIDLKPNSTFVMKDKSSPNNGTSSGKYTVKGNHIWFIMPDGTRRYGRFQGDDIVPNWKDFGLGNPTVRVAGRSIPAKGHRFVKQQ